MRYKGGVISATAPTTSTSAASGVWTLPQQLQAIAAGNWTGMPLVIGQAYQGGFFAGQISTAGNSIADYNLVVGPVASAQSTLQFKTTNTSTTGTSSVIDGPANSSAMNNASHPAAQFCEALTVGGQTDWYMPAKNELEVCYYNLKPVVMNNGTSSGINANAVPARASNYTTSIPARTSATAFQSGGAEPYTLFYYWSSTQQSATYAFRQYMGSGDQDYGSKDIARIVRAVRRVAV
jgi:hypothetical protein